MRLVLTTIFLTGFSFSLYASCLFGDYFQDVRTGNNQNFTTKQIYNVTDENYRNFTKEQLAPIHFAFGLSEMEDIFASFDVDHDGINLKRLTYTKDGRAFLYVEYLAGENPYGYILNKKGNKLLAEIQDDSIYRCVVKK